MAESQPAASPTEDSDMTPKQAAEHLRVIRELMERPIRNTTRSGVAGILAGLLALAGSALTWWLLPQRDQWTAADDLGLFTHPPDSTLLALGAVWLGVFVAAAAADILMTRRRARQRGETWWKREQVQTALAIAPGFVLAGFFTWLFAGWAGGELVPFGWMIGYAVALWTVGMFSITEVKVLGAAFLLAGCLGMAALLADWAGVSQCTAFPVAALAVTFGGFHLVYGAVVWARHGG